MKGITIKDIARDLGVAASTVSRALQNHPDISEETRKAVHAYAREHNYKPNIMASNLRTARNTTIGLLIPSATHYFYARALRGVEQAAAEAGYSVVITQSEEDPALEQQVLRTLSSLRVAGVLACISRNSESLAALNELVEDEIPVVLFDRLTEARCDQVVSDDFGGAFRAVEYMIQTGARKVAYYSSKLEEHTSAERFRGYREALKKYDIPFDPTLVLECNTRSDALVMTPDFFRRVGKPDAVLAVNDHTAAGILQSAKTLNIRVPEDLQICGFSNDTLTRHTDPMLTTVQQHAKEMGGEAMRLLIERIQESGEHMPPKTLTLPTDLIVRETTF